MTLLLDTCAFLWLTNEPRKLSRVSTAAINDPENEIFLSDTSVWEMVLKHGVGKLPLPGAPREWIPRQMAAFHLTPLTIRPEAIYRAGELPPVHTDPFDRLLAAQALLGPFRFITPDPPFRSYGVDCVW